MKLLGMWGPVGAWDGGCTGTWDGGALAGA